MSKEKLNPNFVLVVIAQITSLFGSAMLHFALDLYILDITGRADIFAAVIAITTIPRIVFSPIGGAIADRFNRRNLMVIFDFASGAIVVLLIFLMSIDATSIFVLGIIMTMLGIISAMYQPAVSACVPTLVSREQLAGANGIVNGVGSLSGLMGPVLGGVLYGVIGLKTLVIITGAVFFFSAIMEIFIQMPFTKRESDKHIIAMIFNDLKDGFHYIAKVNPFILKIGFLAVIINFAFSPIFSVGAPYILRVTMNSSDFMYGIGMGLGQLSMIIGALLTGVFAKWLKISKIYFLFFMMTLFLLPMAIALTPALLELGYWPSFILFFVFAMVSLALGVMLSVYIITDIQKITPNEMLGKVMAIIMSMSLLASPFGQVVYGFLFQAANNMTYLPVLVAALLTIIVALVARKLLHKQENA